MLRDRLNIMSTIVLYLSSGFVLLAAWKPVYSSESAKPSQNLGQAVADFALNSLYVTRHLESVFDMGPNPVHVPVALNAWMESLYSSRPNMKLKDIMIPGTHNSASARINKDSAWAMGSEKNLPKIGRKLGRKTAVKWGRTQKCSITAQLNQGIRFLDLRVAPSLENTGHLFVVHGVVSAPLELVLREIASFVFKHPREVVIIKRRLAYDFRQHHPDLVAATEQQMNSEFARILGGATLSSNNAGGLSFNTFWTRGKSIAVIDEPTGIYNTWSDSRTNEIDELPSKLEQSLREQKQGAGRLLELAVYLTPETKDILGKITSKRSYQLLRMQAPFIKKSHRYIERWSELGLKINIISIDFYEASRVIETAIKYNFFRLAQED